MKILSSFLATVFVFSLTTWFGTEVASAQGRPTCEYASSDPDGDGFGWENRKTCVVTSETTDLVPAGCVDNDGDGWGWDGQRVCRVAANNCYDSDPVGDGWGWNGVTSCPLSEYLAPFSELAVLREKTPEGNSTKATIVCTYDGVDYETNFYRSGSVIYNRPDGRLVGSWSTGFSDSDGILHLHWGRPSNGGIRASGASLLRSNFLILPGSVQADPDGTTYDTDDCRWM